MAVVVGFSLTAICSTSKSSGCNCPSEGGCPGDLGDVLGGLMMVDTAVTRVL